MADYELIFEVGWLTDTAVDTVYDNYDAIIARHANTELVTVTAQGTSAVEAAQQVIEHLEHIVPELVVSRCYEDLVDRKEIAERCDVSVQAVGQWIRGVREVSVAFPGPFNHVAGGVWLWRDVNDWLRRSNRSHDELRSPCREEHADINQWINRHRSRSATARPAC